MDEADSDKTNGASDGQVQTTATNWRVQVQKDVARVQGLDCRVDCMRPCMHTMSVFVSAQVGCLCLNVKCMHTAVRMRTRAAGGARSSADTMEESAARRRGDDGRRRARGTKAEARGAGTAGWTNTDTRG